MTYHVQSYLKRFNILYDIIASQEKTLCFEQHMKVRSALRMMDLIEFSAREAKKLKLSHERKSRAGGLLQISVGGIEVDLRAIYEIRIRHVFNGQTTRNRASNVNRTNALPFHQGVGHKINEWFP